MNDYDEEIFDDAATSIHAACMKGLRKTFTLKMRRGIREAGFRLEKSIGGFLIYGRDNLPLACILDTYQLVDGKRVDFVAFDGSIIVCRKESETRFHEYVELRKVAIPLGMVDWWEKCRRQYV